jgi:hypothetical protein
MIRSQPYENRKEYVQKVKYEKIICERTKNFTDVIGNDLEQNVQYRLVTERAFNAIIVIEYLLKKYELVEVYIAVYRMNIQSVNKLKQIIDLGNIKCSILLSSFFRENKKYERWCEDLIMYCDKNKNVQINFAVNHAKVFLAKTKDNRYIVFEGSGNLSDNARIEQYLIEDNKTTYEFHKKWITNTLDNAKSKQYSAKNIDRNRPTNTHSITTTRRKLF